MRRRWWGRGCCGGALTLLVVAACRTPPAPASSRSPDSAPVAALDQDQGPTLAEIADAIDPGPVAPLTADLPAWLSTGLSLPSSETDAEDRLQQARAAWQAWENRSTADDDGVAEMLQALVELARALALAERAAGEGPGAPPGATPGATIEALLLLEPIYSLIDVPQLANDRSLFARMVPAIAAMITEGGEVQLGGSLEELWQRVAQGLRSAGGLHLRTVSQLLRSAPQHPSIPEVLSRTAQTVHRDDEALAVGIMRRSLALRGVEASAAHWLDLASICYRSLEFGCGDQARRRAKAQAPADDDALAERLRESLTQAKHAHAAVELRDAPGLEDRLEQAGALMELSRYADAQPIYEQLHRLHPDDARPVAGLANVALSDRIDFVGAYEILERARPRDHLDQQWYELAIGVRATMLLDNVLPQLADQSPDEIFATLRPALLQMDADIAGLEATGADQGKVLRYAYDLGLEAWPKLRADSSAQLLQLVRAQLARARALQAQVPHSRHAYTLVLAAAELSDDRAAALSVLDLPPPPMHAEALAARRAQAALDLVATWDAAERVDQLVERIVAIDRADQPWSSRRLAVDARVVARRLGHPGELAALEQRYRGLRQEPSGAEDPLLLNNLAAVVAQQGRTADALALLTEAEAHAEPGQVDLIRLNMLGTRIRAGVFGAPEREDLEALQRSTAAVEVRLLAHAWRVVATTGREQRRARAALAAAAAEEASTNFRPRNLPGRAGVILRGTLEAGLGYSTTEGLQLELDTAGVPWLVVPCAEPIPDPRAE
ncbi:MAG: hypothetical protein AB1Z98_26645 [Nannocystaceae bacterium]